MGGDFHVSSRSSWPKYGYRRRGEGKRREKRAQNNNWHHH
jgi:hypothetical protein